MIEWRSTQITPLCAKIVSHLAHRPQRRRFLYNIANCKITPMHWLLDSHVDLGPPQVREWFLVKEPMHALYLLAGYYVVVWLLMVIMKNKKEPFQLYTYSQIHNACMVLLSLY